MSLSRFDPNAFKVIPPEVYQKNLADIQKAKETLEAYERMNEVGRKNFEQLEQEELELERRIQEGQLATQRLQQIRDKKRNAVDDFVSNARIEEISQNGRKEQVGGVNSPLHSQSPSGIRQPLNPDHNTYRPYSSPQYSQTINAQAQYATSHTVPTHQYNSTQTRAQFSAHYRPPGSFYPTASSSNHYRTFTNSYVPSTSQAPQYSNEQNLPNSTIHTSERQTTQNQAYNYAPSQIRTTVPSTTPQQQSFEPLIQTQPQPVYYNPTTNASPAISSTLEGALGRSRDQSTTLRPQTNPTPPSGSNTTDTRGQSVENAKLDPSTVSNSAQTGTAEVKRFDVPIAPTRQYILRLGEVVSRWTDSAQRGESFPHIISYKNTEFRCVKGHDDKPHFVFTGLDGRLYLNAVDKFLDFLLKKTTEPATSAQPPQTQGEPASVSAPVILPPSTHNTQEVLASVAPAPASSALQSITSPSTTNTVSRTPKEANLKNLASDILYGLGKRRRENETESSPQVKKHASESSVKLPRTVENPGPKTVQESLTASSFNILERFNASQAAFRASQSIKNTSPLTSGIPVPPAPPSAHTSVFRAQPTPLPSRTLPIPNTATPQSHVSTSEQPIQHSLTINGPVTTVPSIDLEPASKPPPSTTVSSLQSVGDSKNHSSPAAPFILVEVGSSTTQENVPQKEEQQTPLYSSNKGDVGTSLIPEIATLSEGGADEQVIDLTTPNLSPPPPPPESASSPPVTREKEPLFLPSPSSNGDVALPSFSPVKTLPQDGEKVGSLERLSEVLIGKPRKNLAYVLVPPPPKRLIQYRKQQGQKKPREMEKGKGKEKDKLSQSESWTYESSPVTSAEFSYLFERQGSLPIGEEEREAIRLATSRLQPLACRWDGCDQQLNSMDSLLRHLDLHRPKREPSSKTFMCRWKQCGQSGIRFKDKHMERHALLPLRCAYLNCEDTFRSASQLLKHFKTKHGNGKLKPSALPSAATLVPLQEIPERIPSYLIATRQVSRKVISKERHQVIGRWVARNILFSDQDMPPKKRTKKTARSTKTDTRNETEANNDYEFLKVRTTRPSTYSSHGFEVVLDDLDSAEISKMFAAGLTLWGSGDEENNNHDKDAAGSLEAQEQNNIKDEDAEGLVSYGSAERSDNDDDSYSAVENMLISTSVTH